MKRAIKLSEDERIERRRALVQERLNQKERFKSARIDRIYQGHGTIVEFEAGEECWVNVRVREGENSEWRNSIIDLSEDLAATARFINCLCARYNAIVDKANIEARGASLIDLQSIQGERDAQDAKRS